MPSSMLIQSKHPKRRTQGHGSIPFDYFPYFTEFTYKKGIFYAIVLLYVSAVSIVVVLERVIPDDRICNESWITDAMRNATQFEYHNPSYVYNPCEHIRLPALIWMTRTECDFGRRLVASVLLGGIVGYERREADRPAGIRTMSLVSLGACLFSINSAFAFLDGPMSWDSSRIAAAIPSGVGFLGAGLIFKEAEKNKKSGDTTHVVHGLTTAASLWISAAVGTACAGRLYFSATFSVGLILSLLRFGPRQTVIEDDDDDEEEEDGDESGYESTRRKSHKPVSLDAGAPDNLSDQALDPELQPLKRPDAKLSTSTRARKRPNAASLGGIL